MSPGAPASVAAAVHAVRAWLVRRVRLAAVLWAAAGAAAALAAAWWWAGPAGWSQGTAGPLVLDLVLLGLLAGAVAAGAAAPGRWLHDAALARSMEEASGMAEGSVAGALELGRALPPGVSGSLAAHGSRSVAGRLDLPPERLSGGHGIAVMRWMRRGAGGLAVMAPVALLLLVASPRRAARAWAGLGNPLTLLAAPVLPDLRVAPGDAEVRRGSPFTVTVRAPGRERVELHWQAAGDVERSRAGETAAGGARFRLDAVAAETRYWVSAPDGARSPVYRVVPVDPLLVGAVTVTLDFPPYTGRPREEYRTSVPPLVVPEGTRIGVEGRASRILSGAALVPEGEGDEVTLDVSGPAFTGRWTPASGGVWTWSFLDEDGEPAELAPPPMELTVVADSTPLVRFAHPARDTVLPVDLRQPLVLEARDDHGLSGMELVAYRVTSLGEAREPVVQGMDLGGSRAALARPLLDLSSWGLLPGDVVRYHARVRDNAPAPHEARTREWVLRMPEAAEMRRGAQEALERLGDEVEELARRAAEASEETREMERRAAAERRDAPDRRGGLEPRAGEEEPGDRSGFEEREEMEAALAEQEDMVARVDSVRREIEELAEAMREAGTSDPGMKEALEALRELMEETATPEMRERMEELARRMEEGDLERAREAMRQLSEDQETFRQRLEESLERMRQAAAEQDFRATTAEAEELAREQRALADAMEEGDRPELRAEQQRELEERAAELQERMESLDERLDRLDERDARSGVEESTGEVRRGRESMRRAGEQASQGQSPRAAGEARQAAESMERASEGLQEARDQMARQRAQAAREALQTTAEEALSLARRQSEIRDRLQGAGAPEMQELRADEASVMEGLRNMAESLEEEASEGMPPAGMRQMAERMGEAMEAVEAAADAMEGRAGAAPSPRGAAEDAIRALNQVAVSAMAGAQQSSGQGQGSAQDLGDRLDAAAQQQAGVNNQAGQVMPLRLGGDALRRQLEELARAQQEVARELGEMADEPGSGEEALGDLDALAAEAEELARTLGGGRLDAETRERQERLFHRLLDAGRSLEREEYSQERESRSPGAFEPGEVVPLGPDALGGLRFGLPPAEVLGRLTPAERRLVIRYFERLNRESARRPGDPGGGNR